MKNRIDVFAPHLDDETFNCGGTIAGEIKKRKDVAVIYMTDSRNSHLIDLGIATDPTPDEVAAERKNEVFGATAELGIIPANLMFLDFPDGALRNHITNAIERVKRLLLADWPEEIYIPALGDQHTDHKATNEIVVRAIHEIHRPVTVNEYITWTRREIEGAVSDTQDKIGEEVMHDISDNLPAKNRAIDKYSSQISLHWESQSMPVLDEAFLKPFRESTVETFRRYKIC